MNIGVLTDVGLVRSHNEDNYLVEPNLGLFVVADGMGGHQAGEVASKIAVQAIRGYVVKHISNKETPLGKISGNALLAAHQAIRNASNENLSRRGMGTTAVLALIPPHGDAVWVGHIGDSRAYLLRSGKLEQITEDHTVFNQAVLAGVLPEDPLEWPSRHVLSQALGASDQIAPEVTRHAIQTGDRILMCTDGLTNMLKNEEIATWLSSHLPPQQVCNKLVEAAKSKGGKDNITVLVIQVDMSEGGSSAFGSVLENTRGSHDD